MFLMSEVPPVEFRGTLRIRDRGPYQGTSLIRNRGPYKGTSLIRNRGPHRGTLLRRNRGPYRGTSLIRNRGDLVAHEGAEDSAGPRRIRAGCTVSDVACEV